MIRSLGALAWIGLAASLAACGGGKADLSSEKEVRECLVRSQIALQPPNRSKSASSGYAPVYAPDFTVYTKSGVAVDVIVVGSPERARRTAAHVRSALSSLRGSGAPTGATVVSGGNVTAVFAAAPSAAERGAVRSCLAP